MDVIVAREARRAKEARKESVYRLLWCVPICWWIYCVISGMPALDNPRLYTLVKLFLFNLPLQLLIAFAAGLGLQVGFRSFFMILVLINLILVLSGVAITFFF